MRIRTGHRPDQWTDNIPGAVGRRTGVSAWGTHNAVVIGAMTPVLNGRANFTETTASADKRRARNRAANATWRARQK